MQYKERKHDFHIIQKGNWASIERGGSRYLVIVFGREINNQQKTVVSPGSHSVKQAGCEGSSDTTGKKHVSVLSDWTTVPPP